MTRSPNHGWNLRACLAALAALWPAACLEPAAERAARDELVGSARADGIAIDVRDGLAAVRALSARRVELWQSAPLLDVTLELDRPNSLELVIDNAMPKAELTQRSGPPVTWRRHGSARPTQARYTLDVTEAGKVELAFADPSSRSTRPFCIGLMSDVQEAIDSVEDVYERINAEPGVEFLLGAGDLTRRGTVQQLNRFKRELEKLHVPYYTTLGNHELGVTPAPYQDLFGRGSFSFVYAGARFTLLDSASATIDITAYEWLDDWLEQGRDQFHIVATHIPPVDPIGVRNGSFASRNEADKLFAKLLEGKVDLTLYGHLHSYFSFHNAGIAAYVSGGGGAIPEKFDRIGRHFLVIDVDPERQTFETRMIQVD